MGHIILYKKSFIKIAHTEKGGDVALEDILSNVNYNIEKIVEELRKRINGIPEVNEIVDKDKIIYQYSGEDFCIIKIRKDHIEIDFKANKTLIDPIEFSWKIGRHKKDKFDRRMHIKNVFDIDITFGLISQSCRGISSKKNYNR